LLVKLDVIIKHIFGLNFIFERLYEVYEKKHACVGGNIIPIIYFLANEEFSKDVYKNY
jgi:hypothetical protein